MGIAWCFFLTLGALIFGLMNGSYAFVAVDNATLLRSSTARVSTSEYDYQAGRSSLLFLRWLVATSVAAPAFWVLQPVLVRFVVVCLVDQPALFRLFPLWSFSHSQST